MRTNKELAELTGTLSAPSKMPCYSWSIPAKYCKVGSKLAKVEGTVCSDCYALKNRYIFPNVQNALEKRYKALMSNPNWAFDMVEHIGKREKSGYFRWHDSGDIQSLNHLEKIAFIAEQLPHIKFWIPTREYKIVREYLKLYKSFPQNLIVRVSAHKLEKKVKGFKNTSSVLAEGYTCPAPNQDNQCGDCRMCWDKDVKEVSYKQH